jgi:hypothetical protein
MVIKVKYHVYVLHIKIIKILQVVVGIEQFEYGNIKMEIMIKKIVQF